MSDKIANLKLVMMLTSEILLMKMICHIPALCMSKASSYHALSSASEEMNTERMLLHRCDYNTKMIR
jgi:hypothetical protein